MPTTTIYYAQGISANLAGFVSLAEASTSSLRMEQVSDLLCHPCEILIDEPGYTAYGQKDAANWAELNKVAKTPDGQPIYGDILIIDTQA